MRKTVKSIISTILILFVICVAVSSCRLKDVQSPQSIINRWEIISKQGVDIPQSFFWMMMDYIEFRENGEVWALMGWPPGEKQDIRLNSVTKYSLISENQISITGSCRHQDPCTGIYTISLKNEILRIYDGDKVLELGWVSPPSQDRPQMVEGPSATSTPESIQ